MRLKMALVLILIATLAFSALTGCAVSSLQKSDEPNEFMAWQFAQSAVKQRMAQPNKTMFPRYRYADIEVQDDNTFIVNAYVNSQDRNNEEIGFSFTVVARYVGNDVFEEVSVELTPLE
jgi:hypothetical protein